MDAIICDISAFLYWRTPPVVRLLVSEPADSPLLRDLLTWREVCKLRGALAASSPLFAAAAGEGRSRARLGLRASAIADSAVELSVSLVPPVDLLVTDASRRSTSALVRPRLCSAMACDANVRTAAPNVGVTTPLFALQQIAARASLARTVMLASELCGSFSAYVAPEPVRAVLQRLIDEGRLPRISGWSPVLDQDGRLTELWSRPPLSTTRQIREYAQGSPVARGRARLMRAAELVVDGAASPFEVVTGMLLGFSRRLGGEGYGTFSHNRKVALTLDSRRLARRGFLVCDLFWAAGNGHRALDVECQSRLAHASGDAALSDADRSAALDLMGVDVVNVTYGQLADPRRFEALSQLVAQKLGVPHREKTAGQRAAAERLRAEVFVDWATLPNV